MNKAGVCFAFILFTFRVFGQDVDYARKVLNDLCSENMYGRGYVKQGAQEAAKYIAGEFRKEQLLSFTPEYAQPLTYPIIAFPHAISFYADDQLLIPGADYIVGPGSPELKGIFDVVYVDSTVIDNTGKFREFEKSGFSHSLILIDIPANTKLLHDERLTAIERMTYKCRGMVYINQPKLTWSVATGWDNYPTVRILKGVLKSIPKKIKVEIQPDIGAYHGENLIGYIKGSAYPDSFVVFSAHYDHLGMMGPDARFPGGNDNASGTAMMLDLMRYFSKNPPAYSVCFMAFTGEEAGLLGSYYYTEHPVFPLKQISVLINLDLMGTGDKGMTVVNATLFPDDFQVLQEINLEHNYLPGVHSRGKAQNSDHYYFTEKNVKAFFFYLMGNYNAYHDVNDTAEAVTFSRYNEAFRLIRDYVVSVMKTKK